MGYTMRRLKYCCLFLTFCFLLTTLVSCKKIEGETYMDNLFWKEYKINDSKSLDSILKKEYDLNELISFFKRSNINESFGFDSVFVDLSLSKVNNKFPVEVIRSGGYSVYKVIQGGYFYVFWVKPFDSEKRQTNGEPTVYFTAYFSSNKVASQFNSIKYGVSTAKDVKKVDPYLEFSFLISSGIFSYSLLDKDVLLQIEYAYKENIKDYEDLIVKEMKIVSRESAPSRYGAILDKDIL